MAVMHAGLGADLTVDGQVFQKIHDWVVMNIPTSELTPGMRLEKDIHDKSGRLLATAETELTDKHIRIFKCWGIAHAEITHEHPESPPEEAEISVEAMQQATAAATHLFRLANPEHPAVERLFALSRDRMARRLQKQMK